MPRGPNGEKRPVDTNACAVLVAKIATGEVEDDGYKTPGRRRSGEAGAKARAAALDKERRTDIARRAANIRWK